MATTKDPTEPIRLQAADYPEVDEGTACTQNSFKTGKKAFLYIGPQGGRFKAMFKLTDSMPEAVELAGKDPDRFEVGTTGWVTARFTAEKPMPKRLWKRWLDESYESCLGKASGSKTAKKGKARRTSPSTSAKSKGPKRKAGG